MSFEFALLRAEDLLKTREIERVSFYSTSKLNRDTKYTCWVHGTGQNNTVMSDDFPTPEQALDHALRKFYDQPRAWTHEEIGRTLGIAA